MKRSGTARAVGIGLGLACCAVLMWSHPAAALCHADCDGSGAVDVNELVRCVNVALGVQPLTNCQSCDANGDGSVEVSDLVSGVNDSLNGCQGGGPQCPDYVPTGCK